MPKRFQNLLWTCFFFNTSTVVYWYDHTLLLHFRCLVMCDCFFRPFCSGFDFLHVWEIRRCLYQVGHFSESLFQLIQEFGIHQCCCRDNTPWETCANNLWWCNINLCRVRIHKPWQSTEIKPKRNLDGGCDACKRRIRSNMVQIGRTIGRGSANFVANTKLQEIAVNLLLLLDMWRGLCVSFGRNQQKVRRFCASLDMLITLCVDVWWQFERNVQSRTVVEFHKSESQNVSVTGAIFTIRPQVPYLHVLARSLDDSNIIRGRIRARIRHAMVVSALIVANLPTSRMYWWNPTVCYKQTDHKKEFAVPESVWSCQRLQIRSNLRKSLRSSCAWSRRLWPDLITWDTDPVCCMDSGSGEHPEPLLWRWKLRRIQSCHLHARHKLLWTNPPKLFLCAIDTLILLTINLCRQVYPDLSLRLLYLGASIKWLHLDKHRLVSTWTNR